MAGIALSLSGLFGACHNTQRVPAPIWLPEDAPKEVVRASSGFGTAATVIRHAGPVWVQPPGSPAGHSLAFFDKRARLEPGGRVLVGADGRAELLWPGTSVSIVLLGRGEAEIGDARSDLPLVSLRHVNRAQLYFGPRDRVALPGGVELWGEAEATQGPFLVEHRLARVLRIKNQSKLECRVTFRGDDLQVLPGDAIDVPLLGPGLPEPPPRGLVRVELGDHRLDTTGRLAASLEDERARVRALEPTTILVGGVRVHLTEGAGMVFTRQAPQTSEPAPQTPPESRE